MAQLLILSREELESLLTLNEVVNVVEKGFLLFNQGEALAYPVVREFIDKYQGIFGIKSGYVKGEDFLGFKSGGYWKDNPQIGLPGHQSVIVLFDPKTGVARAMMDGNFITVIRTGAVGALASGRLARKDSKVAAMIGCGTQGRIQLKALKLNFDLQEVRCYDSIPENAEAYAKEMVSAHVPVKVFSKAQEAVKEADIVVTTTPSTSPVIEAQWISDGTHINAMGADTKGKQEIDTNLYQKAKVIVDDFEQCSNLGETQHNIDFVQSRGIHAQLGEILPGEKPGRETDKEVTLFDATGIAFQDLVTAGLAMSLAKERNMGTWVNI